MTGYNNEFRASRYNTGTQRHLGRRNEMNRFQSNRFNNFQNSVQNNASANRVTRGFRGNNMNTNMNMNLNTPAPAVNRGFSNLNNNSYGTRDYNFNRYGQYGGYIGNQGYYNNAPFSGYNTGSYTGYNVNQNAVPNAVQNNALNNGTFNNGTFNNALNNTLGSANAITGVYNGTFHNALNDVNNTNVNNTNVNTGVNTNPNMGYNTNLNNGAIGSAVYQGVLR